jgi:hypothetical protein
LEGGVGAVVRDGSAPARTGWQRTTGQSSALSRAGSLVAAASLQTGDW